MEEKAAVVEEKPVAVVVEEELVAVTSEVGNCACPPYDFCCEVGTKCDCSASADAEIDVFNCCLGFCTSICSS